MSRKIYNLGKVKGRTPEFRLTEKLLEIKYDDETIWSTLVDFSTIASSFDLRLNEETLFLEAKRDVNAEWEQVADLSELAKAHEHDNKDILDKITNSVFTNINDAISKKHKHENMSSLNQITDEHIQNINQIPAIQEEISQFAPPQLTEGVLYSDETKKGLSANKNAVPTADYVWIEGEASKYHSFDELMSSATLNVVTTSGAKSTTTTVTINIVCVDRNSAISVRTMIRDSGYYTGVVFEDTPDKTFYIKASIPSISDTTVSMNFTFIDGQETFPITGNITRAIQSICVYPKNGIGSHNEGLETIAAGDYSHAQGKYNAIDTSGKYTHIVGNGSENARSNAYTLDWQGNAWYAGSVEADTFLLRPLAGYEELFLRTTIFSYIFTNGLNWSTVFPLEAGNWYAVTIEGVESIVQCQTPNTLSTTVGGIPFKMCVADFNNDGTYMYSINYNTSDLYGKTLVIEKLSLDLSAYVEFVKDRLAYIESGNISIADLKNSTRTKIVAPTTTTVPYNERWNLQLGRGWYVIKINDEETIFKYTEGNISEKVGDYTFDYHVFPEEDWPPMDEISITGSTAGDEIIFSLDELIPEYKDLVHYINDADAELLDKIESSALTEEQAQNISLNTEARHTHDNQSTLDKITEQTLTDIADNAESISTLTSDSKTEGSIEYKIAQAVSAIMENPDDTMNSIQELVTWCNEHAEDAIALTTQVATNKNDIASLKGLVGETDVATQITNAITEALKVDNVDKYALATDLSNAVTKILEVEQASHSHENKAVLDSISQSAHGNLQIGDALHWRVTNGSVIEGFETDEETGDLTLFIRVAPNPAIPATEIKIKQSHPEIWTAIEALQTELSGTTTTANEILETLGGAE